MSSPSRPWLLGIWLAAAFLLSAASSAAAAEPKQILLLHSFGSDFSPFSDVARSLRSELAAQSRDPINLYEASVYSSRLQAPVDEGSLAKYLNDLFPAKSPDLIVTLGAPAAYFALAQRQRLFPETPMVISGIDDRRLANSTLATNDTVVAVRSDYRTYVENILRLLPETKNIAVVVGNTPNEQFWVSEMRRDFPQLASGVQFMFLNELSLDEMVSRVGSLPPQSAIFYFYVAVDARGVVHPQDAAFARIRAAANAPVFGIGDYHLGKGAVGGPALQTQTQGREAAAVALRILAGEPPNSIKSPPLRDGTPAYDWRELQRWRIDESRLPPDGIVVFRQPYIWDEYRWYIIGAISLMLAQALLIVGFLAQRARRRVAEKNILAKESELRGSYNQVRRLAGRLINAQEEERTRIARELHDDVGQRVASLAIGLSNLKRRVLNADEAARNELSELQQHTMGLAHDLRDLSHELHPGALIHVGLLEALRGRCSEINNESNIRIEVEAADGWPKVADDVELCLYRVAQEALRNITKHAQAQTARVSLGHEGDRVVMRIADDGVGFQTNGAIGQQGIGLLTMRERVRMLDGSFEVQSSSTGTVAMVVIPTGAGQ